MKGKDMIRRVVLLAMLVLLGGISTSAEAVVLVLCMNQGSKVVHAREACIGNEVQLDPVALGLVGPTGPQGPQGVAGPTGPQGPPGPIDGNGTDGFIPRWEDAQVLGDSVIFQDDPGNVGIGTTSPGATLHVLGTGGHQPRIRLDNPVGADGPGLDFYTGATRMGFIEIHDPDMFIRNERAGSLNLMTAGTGVIHMNSAGDVGIGTDNPQHKLDVEGNVQAFSFIMGDLVFQKDNKALWRMYEDTDALYLESLVTKKRYRLVMREILGK